MMNASLDYEIAQFFAGLGGRLPVIDRLVWTLSSNAMLKGGVMIAILLFVWFEAVEADGRPSDTTQLHRARIFAVLCSACFGEILARILSRTLPFRPRPLLESSLHFKLPDGITVESLGISTESSFPSDHGVLFVALAMGIWLVNRRAGIASFAWTFAIILLPRAYLGLHYASDLAIGGVLGIFCTLMGTRLLTGNAIFSKVACCAKNRPMLFYPPCFIALHQIANMLQDVRDLAYLAKAV